jgi:hypothetical protein
MPDDVLCRKSGNGCLSAVFTGRSTHELRARFQFVLCREGSTSISLSLDFPDIVEFVQACGGHGSNSTSDYIVSPMNSLAQGNGDSATAAGGMMDVGLEIDSIAHR